MVRPDGKREPGETITIDGLSGARVLCPESIRELSEILRNERGSIVPVGGATQLHFGNLLRSFDLALDLAGLHSITEYVPADLTVHVEAGVRLEDLQRK